jgi:hypothetical protein
MRLQLYAATPGDQDLSKGDKGKMYNNNRDNAVTDLELRQKRKWRLIATNRANKPNSLTL